MSERVIAIHQPNFLPWLGFFDKWRRSDHFVLLDGVQLIRRSYTTRVNILRDGRAQRLSVPVRHEGTQAVVIGEARVDSSSFKPRKLADSIYHAYGKARGFSAVGTAVCEELLAGHELLAELNTALLRLLGPALGCSWDKVVAQSQLSGEGQKSELMATLTRAAGGGVYLSGGHDPATVAETSGTGAEYNDPEVYSACGVELRYQNFAHPEYSQGKTDFVAGLSALDALMWLGEEAVELLG